MTGDAAKRTPVLVTGAAGFVGRHVLQALERSGYTPDQIAPLIRPDDTWAGSSHPVRLDIADRLALREALAAIRPAAVLHLAAIANPADAAADRDRAWAVNFDAARVLCDACFDARADARFLFVGSSEAYGATFSMVSRLVVEDDPLRPLTPYAATKAAAEVHVGQRRQEGCDAVSLRPFNHSGPGQSAKFVIPSFARQIARIEKGLEPPVIKVGNLEARRDFLDVRDVARAYVAALGATTLNFGTYNIASGTARRVGDLLDLLLKMARVKIAVETDPARLRSLEVPVATGDASRAARDFEWRPEAPIESMLADVLAEWREAT